MIDLSQMRQVRVDAAARRAYVEPGALLADVDRATLEHGLATPLGINSTTGVAGLTLGGGFGWLTRTHGMTVDNLRVGGRRRRRRHDAPRQRGGEPRPVLGPPRRRRQLRRRHASSSSRCTRCGPEVLAGLLVFPIGDAAEILARVPDVHRAGARVAQRLGGAPQGAAAAVPARRGARAGRGRPGGVLRRRPGRRRRAQVDAAARGSGRSSASTSARRRTRLAAGLRSAAHARRAQLLEVAQLHRADRRRHRGAGDLRGPAALATQCEIFVALVGGAANRVPAGRHGLCRTRHAPRDQRARAAGRTPAPTRPASRGPGRSMPRRSRSRPAAPTSTS